VSLGFSPAGTRIRKKVTGRTKTEVRDKLRELHQQVESGLRPRRRYTVGDALDDWLSVGLDGLSARTVSLYRDTIAKALREELGSVRLTELTAGDVQGALGVLASRLSTRTVQIAHNVLVRAIRQAERDEPQCCGAGQAAEGTARRAAFQVADLGAGGVLDGRGPGDAVGGLRHLVAADGAADRGGPGAAVGDDHGGLPGPGVAAVPQGCGRVSADAAAGPVRGSGRARHRDSGHGGRA